MTIDKTLRIYSRLPHSRANGPGCRATIWLSGCPFNCPGCFNAGMRDPASGDDFLVSDLFSWLTSLKGISGITLSGGEPTGQITSLLSLLGRVRKETDLSILLFSGRTKEEIAAFPYGIMLLSLIDVLIDGPYDPGQANPSGVWPSSSNQKIHLLTSRYKMADFLNLPLYEVIIGEGGDLVESGISSLLDLPTTVWLK